MTIEEPAADGVTPEPRGPGRPRDAGRDRAILAATLKILYDKGYAGLTIENVAASAAVGLLIIYRRWRSKAALVVAGWSIPHGWRSRRPTPGRCGATCSRSNAIRSPDQLPASRRVTAGLVADLAADPELGQIYVTQYLVPRRAVVAQVLQRGVDRGELDADADLDFVYDLLLGPLFMRAVVWGQPLSPEAAEHTVEVVLAAFAPKRAPRDGMTRPVVKDAPARRPNPLALRVRRGRAV